MEGLSKGEQDLLYRLVNKGVEAAIEEIDEEFIEKDVITKYMFVQLFVGLERKGMITATSPGDDNWFVDMYGMLNIIPPTITQAGKEYFSREELQSPILEPVRGFEGFGVSLSWQGLSSQIQTKGGQDAEELTELLEDLREMIDNLEQTRQILRNSRFTRKVESQRDLHPWFYSGVLEILGLAVLRIAAGGANTSTSATSAGLGFVDSCSR